MRTYAGVHVRIPPLAAFGLLSHSRPHVPVGVSFCFSWEPLGCSCGLHDKVLPLHVCFPVLGGDPGCRAQ